ncbi:hypothetical protein ACX80W_09505 [Arthrobacter sp. TMN-37]
MGRNGTRAGALLALGLLLSGCGGPGQGREASGSPAPGVSSGTPEPVETAPETAAPAAPASTAAAEPAAPPALNVLPLADLEARVSRLVDAQGQPFALVPQDQLAVGADAVKAALDGVVIDPAECGETVKKNMGQIPADVASATGVSASDPSGSMTIAALASIDDPAILAHGLSLDMSRCAQFTFEVQGQRVTATMEELPVETVGAESVSYLLTQHLPTGQTLYIMAVTAMDGTASASAQQIGTVEPDLVIQDELRRLAGELLTGGPLPG